MLKQCYSNIMRVHSTPECCRSVYFTPVLTYSNILCDGLKNNNEKKPIGHVNDRLEKCLCLNQYRYSVMTWVEHYCVYRGKYYFTIIYIVRHLKSFYPICSHCRGTLDTTIDIIQFYYIEYILCIFENMM